MLAKDILILLEGAVIHNPFNVLELLFDLDFDVQKSYFQEFTFAFRPSHFFGKKNIDSLLKFADINDTAKDDIYYIISNLGCTEAIDVLFSNNIFDKKDLIDTIINLDYKSEKNKEYLSVYRKRLESYPDREYVQSGSDKVKADILEYLIIESNVDKFIENFPKEYHGFEDDKRIIGNYISKIQLTTNQSEEINNILNILENCNE
jgi:hypothetical protein